MASIRSGDSLYSNDGHYTISFGGIMSKTIIFCGKERDLVSWCGCIQAIPFYDIPKGFVSCEHILKNKGISLGTKSMLTKFGMVPTINGYYFFEEYASKYVYAFKTCLLDTFIAAVLEEQKWRTKNDR